MCFSVPHFACRWGSHTHRQNAHEKNFHKNTPSRKTVLGQTSYTRIYRWRSSLYVVRSTLYEVSAYKRKLEVMIVSSAPCVCGLHNSTSSMLSKTPTLVQQAFIERTLLVLLGFAGAEVFCLFVCLFHVDV